MNFDIFDWDNKNIRVLDLNTVLTINLEKNIGFYRLTSHLFDDIVYGYSFQLLGTIVKLDLKTGEYTSIEASDWIGRHQKIIISPTIIIIE